MSDPQCLIQLTDERVEQLNKVALAIIDGTVTKDRPTSNLDGNYGAEHKRIRNLQFLMAEDAAAKYFGVPMINAMPQPGGDKGYDLIVHGLRVDVKSTTLPNGVLIVADYILNRPAPPQIFVLAVVRADLPNTVELKGCCTLAFIRSKPIDPTFSSIPSRTATQGELMPMAVFNQALQYSDELATAIETGNLGPLGKKMGWLQ